MIIFCICSSINGRHSVFSSNERFIQTLNTINSIRSKEEKSYIIFCENTPISIEMKNQLIEKVDTFIDSYNDRFNIPETSIFDYNSGKSTGESYQMLVILSFLSEMEYTKCFKISGRYFLTDEFDSSNFKENKLNFREFDYGYKCFSTVLYSFSKSNEHTLRNFFINYLNNTRPHDLEISIYKLKNDYSDEVNTLSQLGVSGKIGTSGENLIH